MPDPARGLAALACAAALLALPAAAAKDPAKDPPEQRSETRGTVAIDGVAVTYSAVASTITLRDHEGRPKASVFTVAYVKDGEDPATRPVTFAFNGGPGSSSVWLHLGALGPRRVALGPEGEAVPPPGRLVDNASSWLDLTDLVFVDPVSTGYSRAVEGQDPKQFHGLEEDVAWVGELIRLWTTRHGRWGSPKLLAGESYGTTRAAALARHLRGAHGLELNGVVLVSPVLDFRTLRFDDGNDEPYWLFLPSYTAAAWFHGRLEPALQADLDRALAEAERWARTVYLPALAAGDALPAAEAEEVARALARFTGLPVDLVRRSRLRVSQGRFCKELLRADGRTLGRFDARYTGRDADEAGAWPGYDPSYAAVQGPFTAGVYEHVRRGLGFEVDMPYEVLTGRVHPWSYRGAQNRYVNVTGDLRDAMLQNEGLHVLFCGGLYDLATPYFAMDYTLARLDPSLRPRLHRATYRSGHMMYLREEDLVRLKADARRFYAAALRR